ncbi:peptidylprolyl isomerase [Flavobacteriaceae bacterium]|nr:peptidylprolyl isomerase [Flavobacteriaceae bacterium]
MQYKTFFSLILLLFFVLGCSSPKKKSTIKKVTSTKKVVAKEEKRESLLLEEPTRFLDEKNAIPFLYDYQQNDLPNQVKISTRFGEIFIELLDEAPYHKANFIYLTRLGYFNDTFFHRVVPNFVIQGGNSDHPNTSKKRRKIGRYLLPPDLKKGVKHDRGIVSMPSSEMDNPHRLASPYEFFIVQQKGGAYHLDGNYTPFGKVIKGMEVVDAICAQAVDEREAPIDNIRMKIEIVEN